MLHRNTNLNSESARVVTSAIMSARPVNETIEDLLVPQEEQNFSSKEKAFKRTVIAMTRYYEDRITEGYGAPMVVILPEEKLEIRFLKKTKIVTSGQ